MKKKKKPRKHKRPSHRNAAPAVATATPRSRSRISRSAPPDWKTIAAAVAGGAGSAALGGLVVNQQILSPEAVGIGLMLGGGATAYFSDGTPRIVGTSIAAAGAGQFALAMMNKRAIKAHGAANQSAPLPTTPNQLPPPPAIAPRSASSGGFIVDTFQQAASDLDHLEDEWRYGIRDDAYGADSGEPIVIDLDDAA
jgi:hypothetical protein